MRPRPATLRSVDARRGSALWWVIGLLAMMTLFIWFGKLNTKEQAKRQQTFQMRMTDPEIMVGQYFLYAAKDYGPSGDWERLLSFMDSEDVRWFEQNAAALASISSWAASHPGETNDPKLRRYAALQLLTDFGSEPALPVVSSINIVNDSAGVAYVHEQNRLDTMREVFIANEGGEWKIRRFLGRRDRTDVMQAVVEANQRDNRPLSREENEFLKDPAGWPDAMRRELLKEAGVAPQ